MRSVTALHTLAFDSSAQQREMLNNILHPATRQRGMLNSIRYFATRWRFDNLHYRVASFWVLSLLALFITGCGGGDGLNRQPISGMVTVDEKPIPNGSVTFEPLFTGGIGGGAVIANGKYSISRADGLPPGKYRVSITGDDGAGFGVSEGKMPGDEIMPPKKELVPASWNSKSKHEVEVKDSGTNTLDFKIGSKDK